MSKSVEDRYQSTFGLIADLERCRASPEPFALGAVDVSRKFQIPQNLYGRERELEQLGGMFDDVALGLPRICLVSGDAGVGKSALVNELSKSIAGKNGYLIQGKFEQFLHGSAYRAFALAFRGLLQQLLGESETRLTDGVARCRRSARTGGSSSIRARARAHPRRAAERARAATGRGASRFQLVFSFVKVFATEDHPLVVFPSTERHPVAPADPAPGHGARFGHLFVIGAYRSGEVGAGHPLRLAMSEIGKAREIVELAVEPLDRSAVARWIADYAPAIPSACARRCDPRQDAGQRVLHREAWELHEEGAIACDPNAGNGPGTSRHPAAPNRATTSSTWSRACAGCPRYPAGFELAACIGNTFDLETLSVIYQRSMAETGAARRGCSATSWRR
jgi:hypothetical protein